MSIILSYKSPSNFSRSEVTESVVSFALDVTFCEDGLILTTDVLDLDTLSILPSLTSLDWVFSSSSIMASCRSCSCKELAFSLASAILVLRRTAQVVLEGLRIALLSCCVGEVAVANFGAPWTLEISVSDITFRDVKLDDRGEDTVVPWLEFVPYPSSVSSDFGDSWLMILVDFLFTSSESVFTVFSNWICMSLLKTECWSFCVLYFCMLWVIRVWFFSSSSVVIMIIVSAEESLWSLAESSTSNLSNFCNISSVDSTVMWFRGGLNKPFIGFSFSSLVHIWSCLVTLVLVSGCGYCLSPTGLLWMIPFGGIAASSLVG